MSARKKTILARRLGIVTDPKVKDDNAVPEATEPDAKCVTTGDGGCEGIDCMHAVRVYVPTDVRPEMLDGTEAQALRDELAESERANHYEREVLSRVAEALGLAPYGGAYRLDDVVPSMNAQLAEERAAHATLRALWDARCGTIASVQARLTEAEGLLGEARSVAEHFGHGGLAVRIATFLAPRPEPPRARTMLDDIIADGKPGEGLYDKKPCAACGDDLTKCCRECGREYACGGFHGCGRYWRKGILKQTWPKCPGCLPAKEPRPEPAKGGDRG